VIVFDASALVSAAMRRGSVPARAFFHALRTDQVAVSDATMAELRDVLARPRLARFVDPELRDEVLLLVDVSGVPFLPAERVVECRDAKDNKYLELALASDAGVIVSGDDDLLVLHPWRGVRILKPAEYLVEAGPPP
jgi:putative PIN family toxin of toxin-antitoxin system